MEKFYIFKSLNFLLSNHFEPIPKREMKKVTNSKGVY